MLASQVSRCGAVQTVRQLQRVVRAALMTHVYIYICIYMYTRGVYIPRYVVGSILKLVLGHVPDSGAEKLRVFVRLASGQRVSNVML